MRHQKPQIVTALAALTLAGPMAAQPLDDSLLGDFSWRSIGPAATGGRLVDLALAPDDPYTIYAASASGGLFRSRNNAITWECIFQNEGTISIGDIAIDPSAPDTIWVGTGEANNQRSGYWGDGIYKSTDGGETWTNMGLRDSHHIGRIVIDPTDSNIVYVAALGHLYSHNEERGLYKTTDGGERWENVLYISPEVGVVDVVLDPAHPYTIYAASYERLRRAWNFDGAGPGSAIHKSIDGGATWATLEGGLPAGEIGRIGLTISPQDPNILYAAVSNQNRQPVEPAEGDDEARPDLGFEGGAATGGYRISAVTDGSAAAKAGLKTGDIITRVNDVDVSNLWKLLGTLSKVTFDQDLTILYTRDGEEATVTFNTGGRPEPPGRRRQIGGEIYRTADGGETWEKRNEQAVGGSPAYYYGQIRVDPNNTERIYVLSVPVSKSEDGGKTWNRGNLAGGVHVDNHALVIDPTNSRRVLLGNDGGLAVTYDMGEKWEAIDNIPIAQFYAIGVDMELPYNVYGGLQDNGTWGGPSISRSSRGTTNKLWENVGGGDGFYAQIDPTDSAIHYGESQFGGVYRLNMRTWERASIRPPRSEPDGARDRYNWNSPILISHHNPQIIYFGGNKLFKSYNQGDDWQVVSPDLSTADEEKLKGNVPHATITTIAESPIDPNLLLVGTDDGNVQWSADGGTSWTNMAERFPGVPAHWWVSRVELSRTDRDVAYASFTGYREDDFRPFLYRTQDAGATWTQITNGLPDGSVNVVKEDPRNSDVLFVGTEFGAYVSIDRGENWTELANDLPTIPVHDLVVHPRDRDVILGTHGRGMFIMDVGPLQELTAEVLDADVHFFSIEDAYQWRGIARQVFAGNRGYSAPNPPTGASISYHLKSDAGEDEITLEVRDAAGEVVRTLDAANTAGLHRIHWDLRRERRGGNQQQGRRGGGGGGGRFGGRGATSVSPGIYTVVLTVGENEFTQEVNVVADPFGSGG